MIRPGDVVVIPSKGGMVTRLRPTKLSLILHWLFPRTYDLRVQKPPFGIVIGDGGAVMLQGTVTVKLFG